MTAANRWSTGAELVSQGDGIEAFAQPQITALRALVAGFAARAAISAR